MWLLCWWKGKTTTNERSQKTHLTFESQTNCNYTLERTQAAQTSLLILRGNTWQHLWSSQAQEQRWERKGRVLLGLNSQWLNLLSDSSRVKALDIQESNRWGPGQLSPRWCVSWPKSPESSWTSSNFNFIFFSTSGKTYRAFLFDCFFLSFSFPHLFSHSP